MEKKSSWKASVVRRLSASCSCPTQSDRRHYLFLSLRHASCVSLRAFSVSTQSFTSVCSVPSRVFPDAHHKELLAQRFLCFMQNLISSVSKIERTPKKNCPGNYLCTGNLCFFGFFFSLFAGGRRLLLLVLVVPLLFETHFCAAFVYDKMHRILKFGWYIWNFKGTCMPVNKAPDYRLSTEFF